MRGRRGRRLALLVGLALVVLGLVLALALRPAGSGSGSPSAPPLGQGQPLRDRVRRVDPQDLIAQTKAIPVKTGMYIKNLHGLSLAERIFKAEGYYWLEWPQRLQDLLEETKVSAADLVELSNLVDEYDAVIKPYGEVTRLPSGRYRYQARFSGSFYIPYLSFKDSPFDRIALPIVLEIGPDVFALQDQPVVLVPDRSSGALLGAYSVVDGFHLHSAELVPLLHAYGTSWGLDKGDLDYSTLSAVVHLDSDAVASFITYVLPLLIVLAIVFAAPSLEGRLGDVRLAIPTTALLTLIFLQQAYKASLPALSYLTFLDWLYAYAYLVTIALFFLFLWGSNACANAPEDQLASVVASLNRIDLRFQALALIGLVVVGLLAWAL
ncbi:hypothetical protein [Cyanobium gracile]|uniref:Uncharacterized protein n=1 Tax=Cyanobium gracile UHCC 0281 TaxID=3110309 RepID=A0ABU5SZT8_9CYAN|nr:hypothetical protein [Cyanobium gracile]MEA5444040.1 hypothetical protein [Cyanobium gracile UHCC 0281]